MSEASDFDVVLFDLDGVLYIGPQAVPAAIEAVTSLLDRGIRCAYVTNNASRTPVQVADHLRSLGLPCTTDDVITSSQAGATLVAERVAAGQVLAVGGRGVAAALEERGFSAVSTFDEDVVAVMQGYGPEVSWGDLAEAVFAVRAGRPWIATNLDQTFPTPRGQAPGNGALVGVVASVVGRPPDAVAGKPEPPLLREALRRTGGTRPLMVGDRLDTDIAAASRVDMPSLLVLTGVCDAAAAREATGEERPTYVARDLRALLPGRALEPWPGPAGDGR